MPTHSTLNASDAARLQSVLEAIADDSSPSRWSALEQLSYFCDGMQDVLEAIAGKRFSTLTVLLQLLDTVTELGGPVAVRSAPESQRVPVGEVVRLLEVLLCNATSNLKPFLKTATACATSSARSRTTRS